MIYLLYILTDASIVQLYCTYTAFHGFHYDTVQYMFFLVKVWEVKSKYKSLVTLTKQIMNGADQGIRSL
jgi:hypothetical protein